MKKIFYSLTILAAILGTGCDREDDNSTPVVNNTPNSNAMTSGTWRVTLYTEDGADHTSSLAGYNFAFAASGVLTAANGTNTYTGSWSITHDDSSPDDFNIAFPSSPSQFSELTEDWSILENTAAKIRLQHTSGGDGSIDVLTFEKN